MVILRDEDRIAKLKRRSQQARLVGFLVLLSGFVVIILNAPNYIIFQTAALVIGFILSQYGLYLAHRYDKSPRPDEVLDDAVKKVAKDGRLYHFLLPAPHVMLTRAGPIVFVLKYQVGNISAVGDKWKQAGIGFRRFFGQEGLGNPSREAESMVEAMAGYIRKHAPSVEEVPIGAMIVFTSKEVDNLNTEESDIPAMHASKVKGFLRQKGKGDPLPQEVYEELQTAFDKSAEGLL